MCTYDTGVFHLVTRYPRSQQMCVFVAWSCRGTLMGLSFCCTSPVMILTGIYMGLIGPYVIMCFLSGVLYSVLLQWRLFTVENLLLPFLHKTPLLW